MCHLHVCINFVFKVECWSSIEAAVVCFASLLPSLFEILELQLCVESSSVRGLCSGTAPVLMNLMFWVCVSVTALVWILYLGF